jgi:large subunit ribosomal protein L6
MVMTDPVADMLTRLRNANMARHEELAMPSSKLKANVADILKQEGYIRDYVVEPTKPQATLHIALNRTSRDTTLTGLKRVSRPGLRVYADKREVPRVLGGLGIAIISTSQGLMTDREARRRGIGGEVMAYVWSAAAPAARTSEPGAAMSRIGVEPVPIPERVEIRQEGGHVVVTGPNGELRTHVEPAVTVHIGEDEVRVTRASDDRAHKGLHGLTRALIANMVTGVTDGFRRELEIVGVGYRVQSRGSDGLTLQVGYSHPVDVTAPEGVEFEVPSQTSIVVKGADKQKVGQAAANIRAIRPPEPYKGKGIRYRGEEIRRKAGKAAGA